MKEITFTFDETLVCPDCSSNKELIYSFYYCSLLEKAIPVKPEAYCRSCRGGRKTLVEMSAGQKEWLAMKERDNDS